MTHINAHNRKNLYFKSLKWYPTGKIYLRLIFYNSKYIYTNTLLNALVLGKQIVACSYHCLLFAVIWLVKRFLFFQLHSLILENWVLCSVFFNYTPAYFNFKEYFLFYEKNKPHTHCYRVFQKTLTDFVSEQF